MRVHRGACHCGRVQFEVDAPADIEAVECNCSICRMTGFLHLLVSQENFRLLQGADEQSCYTFNTKTALHYFCAHCGIKSYYVPRSHPNGYSVNVNCLAPDSIASISVRAFDGRNWEQNISELSPISD